MDPKPAAQPATDPTVTPTAPTAPDAPGQPGPTQSKSAAPKATTAAKKPPAAKAKPMSASMLPLKPSQFGYEQARHLLWRAGFGGTPTQINTLVKWGLNKSVDQLLNYESIPFDEPRADLFDHDIMRPTSDEEKGELARARKAGDETLVARFRAQRQEAQRLDREQMTKIQHWWLKRMVETPRPLEEKMALFWHGHFATSYRTIEDSYHMYMQNRLFRRFAVGSYAKLLYEIIRDPAMIAYLNNNESRKGKPNENLAREIMELFSLGVGNYTEKDIKEGARALTGYTFDDDTFVFNRKNHDTGTKSILGAMGPLDGDGFVTAILQQPACSEFMCTKLYKFFVADLPTGSKDMDQAAHAVCQSLSAEFSLGNYEIKPVLRKLFLSEHFYQPRVMGERIKSPTELVVGTIRSLDTPARDLGMLTTAMNMMGQNIFYPPSVKGWDGGRAWINTATMFVRQNIACFLLTGRTPSGFDALAKVESYDPSAVLRELRQGQMGDADNREVVDALLRFALGRTRAHNRDLLLEFVGQRGGNVSAETLIQALLLVTAMPEYQLC